MTKGEFIELRERCGLTQKALAAHLGMSLRAVQAIEAFDWVEDVRTIHGLALERIALNCAAMQDSPMIAPASVRKEALKLATLITG